MPECSEEDVTGRGGAGKGAGKGCVIILRASFFSYLIFSIDLEATSSMRLLYLVRVLARI